MNLPMRPSPGIATPVTGDFDMSTPHPADAYSRGKYPTRLYDPSPRTPVYRPYCRGRSSAPPISPYPLVDLRSSASPPMPPYLPADLHTGQAGEECTHENLAEEIRRTNLAVQLVNSMISPGGKCAQLQPKMDRQGRFPIEFRTPRTVEDVRDMDSSVIERLLSFYELPSDLRSFPICRPDANEVPTRVERQAKLCTLFDYLGACRLADNERLKAEKWKRSLGMGQY